MNIKTIANLAANHDFKMVIEIVLLQLSNDIYAIPEEEIISSPENIVKKEKARRVFQGKNPIVSMVAKTCAALESVNSLITVTLDQNDYISGFEISDESEFKSAVENVWNSIDAF